MLSQSWIILVIYYIEARVDTNYEIGKSNYLTIIKWGFLEIYICHGLRQFPANESKIHSNFETSYK
jgi:hypothetical protein